MKKNGIDQYAALLLFEMDTSSPQFQRDLAGIDGLLQRLARVKGDRKAPIDFLRVHICGAAYKISVQFQV